MIEIVDAGMRAAIEQATGHPPPYEAVELAGITALRVVHASDLAELRHCAGLTELELTACDVRSLDEPAGLTSLITLHVLACPIEDAAALAVHPTLTDLRLDFCFIQDIAPLTTIPHLRHGRMLGNPIDPLGWNDLRPRWQRSRTADTGRPRLLEFGPTEEWRYTRQTWEHSVRLCSALLDGLRPVVIRPGIPAAPDTTVDAIQGFGAAVVVAAQRGDPTEEIYRRNAEWAARRGLAPPTDFTSHRTLGDATDARTWAAEASEADRPTLERFVAHFPDGVFFREDAVVHQAMVAAPMPEPVASSRSVLAGLLTDDGARFRVAGYAGSTPRADRAGEIWYLPAAGVYSTDERKELFRDRAGLFPLADWIETGRSILAARIGHDDPAIYEFGEEDLHDTRSAGRPLDESIYRVFASHPELLAHIAAYRFPDGTELVADTATDHEGSR